jgi:hypothetical protein
MQANELNTLEWIAEIEASVAKRQNKLLTMTNKWHIMTIKEEIKMRQGWLEEMRREVA